jgi:hypothetical protein
VRNEDFTKDKLEILKYLESKERSVLKKYLISNRIKKENAKKSKFFSFNHTIFLIRATPFLIQCWFKIKMNAKIIKGYQEHFIFLSANSRSFFAMIDIEDEHILKCDGE